MTPPVQTRELPVLGREHELSELEGLLRRAREGNGGALVLRGEPGVGKSLLLRAARTRAEGFLILSAAGIQAESALAFGALSALLQPLLGDIGALPAVQAGALGAAVGVSATEQVERLACYAGVVSLIAAAARSQPVLVLADDLQWFDAGSREALLFAARRLRSDAVAVAIAIREGESEDPIVTGLPEIRLGGLDESAGIELLSLGADGVSPEVARRLWAQTAGNPLALLEIPRHLSAEQRTGRTPLAEPLPIGRQLEDAFAATAAALPKDCRQALLVAAASYTGAADTIFDALAEMGIPASALEAAEEEGLISISAGGVAWRHPLVRSGVYHGATAPARRAAHAALAQAGDEARLPDRRAWHMAAAAPAPDEEIARALEQVADEASRRGAPATASRAFARAATLSPREDDRARRELAAAEHALSVGRAAEAETLLDAVRAHTDDAALRTQSERLRARVEILRGDPYAAHDRLAALSESLSDSDRPLAAAVMTDAVVARTMTGPVPAYRETAERAFALAAPLGGDAEAIAGLALACGQLLSGETEPARELFDRYGAVAEHPELWRSVPELLGMYACSHAATEGFETADRLFNAVVTYTRDRGALRALPYPLSGRALLDLQLGRWPAALAGAEEAVELSREMSARPPSTMLAGSLAALAQIEASMGRVQATREHAAESLALCKQLKAGAFETEPALALALLALSLGEHDAAVGVWTQVTVDVREWVAEPGWEHIDDVVIEANLRAGRAAQAEQELAHLEAKAARSGRRWAHAVAARCRGLLAPAGELDEHFRAALEWHRGLPLPFDRARTELCYGERLRRARRRSDAREQLESASATFRALGATIWGERAERELAAAGYGGPVPAEQSPWAELTAAETRVAQVIIDGATYDEAASALFVSPRTIETHLRQIYRKLGVRSRSELTRRLAAVAAA